MGGASKLLSSLLLTSSPLRLRPSATSAAALFLYPPAVASRHLLLIPSPSTLRTLSTASSAAAAALPHGSSSSSASTSPPPPRAPFPEWSRLVDRLAAAGYALRPPCPADELAHASGCDLSDGAEAAVFSCLAFARERPDLLRSLPRKDVEVLVAKASPSLFKDGEASLQRLQRYLAGEEDNVVVSERAETVDIVRCLLSYAYCSSDNYSEDKELTDTAMRNILSVLENFSGFSPSSSSVESTLWETSSSQHEPFSRPPRQNIEMKRGDWICTRCRFMNFARNVRCLECNEQRPKKMLTGGEWECPKCEFYNYGRNMSCLRCDCKRPATIPPNQESAGTGLSGVAQLLNVGSVGESEIARKLAENDEKAERWLSKASQLDNSVDLSSLAEDEDFPEIMPMRKGVNKFVVSTRKTPLERRLANAQYTSNNGPQTPSSDSKISQTLDRILGRSTSTATPNNQSGSKGANAEAPKKTDYLGGIDPVPFVPLSADHFAKLNNSNGQRNINDTEAISSMTNSTVSTDEYFPEMMPMRKGENRFVVSKKKDRSLTSPQYKRRSLLEQADDSNFIPFVPFPPDYFAKKDKPVESTSDTGTMSEGSPATEKRPETNVSSGNSSNTSHVVDSQPKGNMNSENFNRNYSQQNFSSGSYGYGESSNYQHQPHSYGHSWPSGSSSTDSWSTDYSQGSFTERRGESSYNGTSPDLHSLVALLLTHQDRRRPLLQIHTQLVTRKAFDQNPAPWRSLLKAYSHGPYPEEALHLFRHARRYLADDTFAFAFALKACAGLGWPRAGVQLHALVVRKGFEFHTHVHTALANMYVVCGRLVEARNAFDEMPAKNVVSWNVMITGFAAWGEVEYSRLLFEQMPCRNVVSWTGMIDGYTRACHYGEAVVLFCHMMAVGVSPSEITVLAVIPAISNLGGILRGEMLHGYCEKKGLVSDVRVRNSLIDLYAKIGSIRNSLKIFNEMLDRRNLVSWTSIISGFAMHGLSIEAVELFADMRKAGIWPNRITFLSLINACSHGGLVGQGLEFFRTMVYEYNMNPEVKHFGCIIDMLGRAGCLCEAEQIIEGLPMEVNVVVWRILLGCCSKYGEVQIGERAIKRILELERESGGDFAVLSNMLNELGRFSDAEHARKLVDERKTVKLPGLAFVGESG